MKFEVQPTTLIVDEHMVGTKNVHTHSQWVCEKGFYLLAWIHLSTSLDPIQ